MVLWAVWLLVIVCSFALFEGLALRRGTPTLSRWVWTVSKAWPPFPYVAGFVTGFLACHFFWGGIVCFAPVSQIEMNWQPELDQRLAFVRYYIP